MSDIQIPSQNEIADCYYDRDIRLNINNNQTIINAMKKLGYLNFNYNDEVVKYERLLLQNYINNNYRNSINVNMKINDILNNIKQTNEYHNFIEQLNNRLNKSIIFSKYINDNDTKEFYQSLTIEELEILGF